MNVMSNTDEAGATTSAVVPSETPISEFDLSGISPQNDFPTVLRNCNLAVIASKNRLC